MRDCHSASRVRVSLIATTSVKNVGVLRHQKTGSEVPKMRIINHLFGRDYTILSRFLETVLDAVLEDEFVTFGDGFFGVVGVDPWSLNREKGTP